MRILIIDDDQLVSLSLKTILGAQAEIEVVGTGNSGQEGIDLYRQTQPDILLMDIRMGDMTGLEAAEIILQEFPQALIIFLTTFLDNDYVIHSLKIGAKGYILKQNFESIVPAIKAVQVGQSVFGEQIVSLMPNLLSAKSADNRIDDCLSQREQTILAEIAEGLNNKEIAEKLFLSEGTVRNYISTMLDKLQLRDRTQLAIYYYKNS
ncbi:response regulator transcription factor [Vagococcus sp. BWB3-3]|uniref:Response regulator transcription factor n=1 Tax=Vagococcus allomyrinae TaxID=2794353 RepID=A0A940P8W3_9ENTE|nr:response regulator transcription factor [Vagococcus allomyrinae]MBP1043879.1 response regulator transcription factor [Vagococcus allomyrinae]